MTSSGRRGGKKAAKELGVEFLGDVQLFPEMVEMGDAGKPAAGSKGGPSEALTKIIEKIEKDINL